jgi:hypothetical protein
MTATGEWRADPFGRHEYRYWDGSAWTEHVSDRGMVTSDPTGQGHRAPPPPPVPGRPYGAVATAAPVPIDATARNNGLAIASMVLGIVWVYWIGSILAVIFGHVALRQIKRSQGAQRGRGMAIAGVVLGYVGIAALVVFIVILATVDFDTGPGAAVCSRDRADVVIAEEAYHATNNSYGTEAELVNAGFLGARSQYFDVRLVNAGLDYVLIGEGGCSSAVRRALR